MRNSAGPDDTPDAAPDQHVRPRHVAPLRTADDRPARLGLERPPATAEFHTRPLGTARRPSYSRERPPTAQERGEHEEKEVRSRPAARDRRCVAPRARRLDRLGGTAEEVR